MQSYWSTEVTVNGICKISSGDTSLSKALVDAIQSCIYCQVAYPAVMDFDGTLEDARRHYVGNYYNLGDNEENVEAVKVIEGKKTRCFSCDAEYTKFSWFDPSGCTTCHRTFVD